MNTNWNVDVAATYGGVESQGKFNASVKSTDQYKTFFQSMSSFARAVGGDSTLSGVLSSGAQNDTVYTTYQAWQNTSLTNPAVISMQLVNIWAIMAAASNPSISTRATDFGNAFTWITENPPSHTTSLTFTVTSDWGYFTLLSPGCVILVQSRLVFVVSQTDQFWNNQSCYQHKNGIPSIAPGLHIQRKRPSMGNA